VIGGGSSINAQIYTRGNALDYDDWRQMGCPGWGYEDVLPYFRKAEDNDTFDNRYHGKGGPLGVSQPSAPLPICEAWFAAGANGHSAQPRHDRRDPGRRRLLPADPAQRIGGPPPRWLIWPGQRRANLTVKTGAQVRRIIVRRAGRGGAGWHEGIRAGSRGHPVLRRHRLAALLHAVGHRPGDHLKSASASPVVLDQPQVGANLQDHLDLFVIAECTGPHTYDRYAKPLWSALAGCSIC
jgi:choline dehydrogenase